MKNELQGIAFVVHLIRKTNKMGEILFSVRGFDVKKGAIYKILPKPDADAPDGLRNLGTTKIPSAAIANDVGCKFVITNKANNKGVYDTGLYPLSPCYNNMNQTQVNERVNALQINLVEPYEKKYSQGILFHKNEEFWDSFKIRLADHRVLSSDNIDDLLDLFIALNSFELTPKNKVGDPAYKASQYCIEDTTKVQTVRNERAQAMVDSLGQYSALKQENPDKLNNILTYIGVLTFNSTVSKESLDAVVLSWLQKNEQNPARFSEAYKLSTSKNTENIVYYYNMLGNLTKTGVVVRSEGIYRYNGTDLGADLKVAAKFLNGRSKEAKALAVELSELYTKDK